MDDESSRWLDFVLAGATRMQGLIAAILEFATAGERGRLSLIDTNAVLQAAVDDLRTSIDRVQAQIHVEPLPSVYANDKQLGRVFLNLIGNAIKYHGRFVPIEIWISRSQRLSSGSFR